MTNQTEQGAALTPLRVALDELASALRQQEATDYRRSDMLTRRDATRRAQQAWRNLDALAAAPIPTFEGSGSDDWRQYATEHEVTAQAVIERHRAEHDALLTLLAADRRKIADLQREASAWNAALTDVTARQWKAEPVHWRAVLDPEQVPHQLKESMHAVGFRTKRSGDAFVAEQLDFQGWRYTLEPLFAAPVVSQPQAQMVDCTPPATSREKWFYEQGRLAERDPRTHAAEATLRDLRLHEAADHMDWLADRLTHVHHEDARVDYIRAARRWSAWLRRIAGPAVPPPEQEDTKP